MSSVLSIAAHLSRETVNHAAEIKLLADRKAGDLLKQLQKSKGGGDQKSADAKNHSGQRGGSDSEYRQVLKDTETSERTAERWQKVLSQVLGHRSDGHRRLLERFFRGA